MPPAGRIARLNPAFPIETCNRRPAGAHFGHDARLPMSEGGRSLPDLWRRLDGSLPATIGERGGAQGPRSPRLGPYVIVTFFWTRASLTVRPFRFHTETQTEVALPL